MTNASNGLKPYRRSKKPYNGPVHTPKSSKGLGDYYGSGIPAKLAKIREGLGTEVLSSNKLKKPPKSLA